MPLVAFDGESEELKSADLCGRRAATGTFTNTGEDCVEDFRAISVEVGESAFNMFLCLEAIR